MFFVVLVTTFGVVQSAIEVSLGDIGPSVNDQEIQIEFPRHQDFGVTDTGLALTGTFDFHAESKGIEPSGVQTRHGFLDRLPTI